MDPLNDNVASLLNQSTDKFVSELWRDGESRQTLTRVNPGVAARCGNRFHVLFLFLFFLYFIVLSFSFYCPLCFYPLVFIHFFLCTAPFLSVVFFSYWASEVQKCQRAYFYQRFPILHSDSGDWVSLISLVSPSSSCFTFKHATNPFCRPSLLPKCSMFIGLKLSADFRFCCFPCLLTSCNKIFWSSSMLCH